MNLSAYQCYRMREMRTPKRVLENHTGQIHPRIPPTKLNMRVVKVSDEKVAEKKAVTQSVKMKVAPQYGVQLVSQQGIVKTIPVVNISQSASGSQTQLTTTAGVASVLKQSDKINASFAQLVQTSTGKHLLLTSNPNITGNIPVTTTTQGGQKLTLLSKQAVSTTGNAGHQITKAYVKFHITSVTTATTTTTVTTTGSNAVQAKEESGKDDGTPKTVGAKFIEQLYANQNSLDVRWGSEEKEIPLPGEEDPKAERRKRYELMARVNEMRCTALPLYGRDFQESIKIFNPCTANTWVGGRIHCLNTMFNRKTLETTDCLKNMLFNPEQRIEQLKHTCDRFIFYVPPVKAAEPELQVWHPNPSKYWGAKEEKLLIQRVFSKPATPLHHIASAMVTQFPDPRLIQYDCGKLQTLDRLLRQLKQGQHRVLIFTQMTKMLDVLEAFLNFHGHIYLRLDGSTKVDQRQVLMERFNGDKRIFAFILSTRSGGVGVNLTGADTVIFYDSDWNPTMDAQAQDRCHRIGQTRDVHIYRLVSERTIEENILKKANQKRLLGDLAIEGGNFTTAYFKSSTIQDLFNIDQNEESAANRMSEVIESSKERERKLAIEPAAGAGEDKIAMGALENALAACEDDQDVQAARTAKAEAVADLAEFDENIPLDEPDKEKEPEMSKAEQEIDNVIKKLSPIERYAMRFIEETESAWSAEQLAAAARQIEEQKREWEQNRLAAMKEEEERRTRELEEEADMLTFSREDATNQVSTKNKKLKSKKILNKSLPTPKFKKKKIMRSRSISESKSNLSTRLRSKRLSYKAASDDESNNDSVITDCNNEEPEETVVNEEVTNQQDDVEQPQEEEVEEVVNTKVNGETDSNSMDSIASESDLTLAALKGSSNHVDHNSPRTRSRGTVAINLWTLDVSPILPGVKPVKSQASNNSIGKKHKHIDKESEESETKKQAKRNLSEDDSSQSDVEATKPVKKKPNYGKKGAEKLEHEATGDEKSETKHNAINKSKICTIVLNDIVADGQYKIPLEDSSDNSDDSKAVDENDDKNKCHKAADDKTRDEKSTENTVTDAKSTDCKTTDSKLANSKTIDVDDEATDSKSTDTKATNSKSADSKPTGSTDKSTGNKPEKSTDKSTAHKSSDQRRDSVISIDLTESDADDEIIKENIEHSNIPNLETKSSHTDNGIDDIKTLVNKTTPKRVNSSFKSPECRRSIKQKFNKSGNKTLDCWVTRSPKNTPKNEDDDPAMDDKLFDDGEEAKHSKRTVSDTDIDDSELALKKIKSK